MKDQILFAQDRTTLTLFVIIIAVIIIAMVIKMIVNIIRNTINRYINKRVYKTLKSRKSQITPAQARERALTNFFYNRIEEDVEKTNCGTSANAIHLIKLNSDWSSHIGPQD